MTRFAIVVTIKLHPGKAEEFKPHILANATAAVRDEPECHLFHVMQSEDDPDTFLFYEVYTDAVAFDAHQKTDHFAAFGARVADLVAEKSVQTWNRVGGAGGA